MPQKLEIYDSTVWAERALVLCRRKIHDEDILKVLRQVDGKSSEDVNNRPLIGVLSQVRGHPATDVMTCNGVLRIICADRSEHAAWRTSSRGLFLYCCLLYQVY